MDSHKVDILDKLKSKEAIDIFNIDYMEVERIYKENETFRFFRERDLIFDE